MAAPSGTQWGSISGSGNKQGRIGIYVSLSNTNTITNVTIDVWFWSRVSVDDSSNSFYFDNEKSSATTSRGSVDIRTTSNSSWSTSNQVKIYSYSYSYARVTSSFSKSCAAKLTGIEWATGTMTVSISYTIPALASYTVKYNANGGTGAPGQQTKYYGKNLILSGTKPSRTGYTFQGWATSSAGGVAYASGATYTANAAVTLYAVWKINTWTVKYDANGGTGAPASQTKTYGQTLKLSTTKPTRTDYNFLGWGISPDSTSVAYQTGGSYTDDAAITLYAIWEIAYVAPRIKNLTADRCTSNGTLDDEGTYIKVAFNWESDEPISATASYIEWLCGDINGSVDRRYFTASEMSGTSGSISVVVSNGSISAEYIWNISIHLVDKSGYNNFGTTVPTAIYTIDFRKGGKGIAIGEAATDDGFSVNMESKFKKEVTFEEMMNAAEGSFSGPFSTPWVKTNSNGRPAFTNHVGLNNGIWMQLATAGNNAFTDFVRMNADNQVEINWTSGGLKGRVMKELWSGTLSTGYTVTSSDFPYYNLFVIYVQQVGGDSEFESPIAIGIRNVVTKHIAFFGGLRGSTGNSYYYHTLGQLQYVSSTVFRLTTPGIVRNNWNYSTATAVGLNVTKIYGVI